MGQVRSIYQYITQSRAHFMHTDSVKYCVDTDDAHRRRPSLMPSSRTSRDLQVTPARDQGAEKVQP